MKNNFAKSSFTARMHIQYNKDIPLESINYANPFHFCFHEPHKHILLN